MPLRNLVLFGRGIFDLTVALINYRMGKLERMHHFNTPDFTNLDISTDRVSRIDGHLPVYAVRHNPPQTGNTHFQGQVLVNGHLVVGTG